VLAGAEPLLTDVTAAPWTGASTRMVKETSAPKTGAVPIRTR